MSPHIVKYKNIKGGKKGTIEQLHKAALGGWKDLRPKDNRVLWIVGEDEAHVYFREEE